MSNSIVRWVPALVVPAAIIAGTVVIPVAADAAPRLPEKSAQEVLAMIADAGDTQFAGTFEQVSNLGLPEIPSFGRQSSEGSALELLTGSRTVRVFIGAENNTRLQVMDELAQRDVILSGTEVWTYDSAANTATYLKVTPEAQVALEAAAAEASASDETEDNSSPVMPDETSTPEDFAQELLDAIDPTTEVTVGDTARVAGRAVYTVTITPNDAETLVESATLSVDAETGMPLAVDVMAVGQAEPALSLAYSSIQFAEQDPALFSFTAPEGSTVTETIITAEDVAEGLASAEENASMPDEASVETDGPNVIGEGWSTIVSFTGSLDELTSGGAGDAAPDEQSTEEAEEAQAEALALLDQVTTPVDGGRVIQTSLFSVFLTDDGRVLAGAVSPAALVAAAQR